MNQQLFRSFNEPIRENLTWAETWKSEDHGLIKCWEVGRKLAEDDPELSIKAKRNELPTLGWKGGFSEQLKIKEKYGTLNYLAKLQGLRGENLSINLLEEVELTCAKYGIKVVFTGDASKYSEA